MSKNISFNNKQVLFNDTDTSILECLEKNDIHVEYQCRDGYCGACRCKLTSGTVNHIKESIAFVENDEILMCCTTPKTDICLKI